MVELAADVGREAVDLEGGAADQADAEVATHRLGAEVAVRRELRLKHDVARDGGRLERAQGGGRDVQIARDGLCLDGEWLVGANGRVARHGLQSNRPPGVLDAEIARDGAVPLLTVKVGDVHVGRDSGQLHLRGGGNIGLHRQFVVTTRPEQATDHRADRMAALVLFQAERCAFAIHAQLDRLEDPIGVGVGRGLDLVGGADVRLRAWDPPDANVA